MLKRLSIVLAATAVMGVCMAMLPQKVEAKTYVWHSMSHYPVIHGEEAGVTWCRDVRKDFNINDLGLASKGMGWFSKGKANVGAKMKCGNEKSRNVDIPRWGVKWNHFWLW
jgi:hypothetical protein